MYLNTLFHRMREYLETATSATFDTTEKVVFLGKTRFYSLEKLLQHQTAASTANVQIGYEINVKHGCMVFGERRSPTAPFEYIEAAQEAIGFGGGP